MREEDGGRAVCARRCQWLYIEAPSNPLRPSADRGQRLPAAAGGCKLLLRYAAIRCETVHGVFTLPCHSALGQPQGCQPLWCLVPLCTPHHHRKTPSPSLQPPRGAAAILPCVAQGESAKKRMCSLVLSW